MTQSQTSGATRQQVRAKIIECQDKLRGRLKFVFDPKGWVGSKMVGEILQVKQNVQKGGEGKIYKTHLNN